MWIWSFQSTLRSLVFSFPQAGDGWGAEAAGDWGTEESWESVDGNQSEHQSLLQTIDSLINH